MTIIKMTPYSALIIPEKNRVNAHILPSDGLHYLLRRERQKTWIFAEVQLPAIQEVAGNKLLSPGP